MPIPDELEDQHAISRKIARKMFGFADVGLQSSRVTKPTSRHGSPRRSRTNRSRRTIVTPSGQAQNEMSFSAPWPSESVTDIKTQHLVPSARPLSWHPANHPFDYSLDNAMNQQPFYVLNKPIWTPNDHGNCQLQEDHVADSNASYARLMMARPTIDFGHITQQFSGKLNLASSWSASMSHSRNTLREPTQPSHAAQLYRSTSLNDHHRLQPAPWESFPGGLQHYSTADVSILMPTEEPELVGLGLYDDDVSRDSMAPSPPLSLLSSSALPRKSLVLEEGWQPPPQLDSATPCSSDEDEFSLSDFYNQVPWNVLDDPINSTAWDQNFLPDQSFDFDLDCDFSSESVNDQILFWDAQVFNKSAAGDQTQSMNLTRRVELSS